MPPACAQPLIAQVGSRDKEEVVLPGGHVSLVAGPNAVRRMWPKLDTLAAESLSHMSDPPGVSAHLVLRRAQVEIARMTPTMAGDWRVFVATLPTHDLLFLTRDISHPKVIDAWMEAIEGGEITSLVARSGARSRLHGDRRRRAFVVAARRRTARPRRARLRGHGLGRALIQACFVQALELGLQKLFVQMTVDQRAAITVFEEIGFRAEALLRKHVKDRDGQLARPRAPRATTSPRCVPDAGLRPVRRARRLTAGHVFRRFRPREAHAMVTRTKIKLDPLHIDGVEVGRVLITGASTGIGAELAREFARNGHRLTLVARSKDKLARVAAELETEFNVDVKVIVQDLAKPAGPATVVKAAKADGEEIGILVNNAGVIDVGAFAASATDKLVGLINLNVRALTELTSLLLPRMVERRFGRILNVASLAAFQPVPSMAAYAASKAYVLALSEALAEEAQGQRRDGKRALPRRHRHRHGHRDQGGLEQRGQAAQGADFRSEGRRGAGLQGADGGAGGAGLPACRTRSLRPGPR